MKYQVTHKLTKQPVRDTKTLEVFIFDSKEEAQKLCDMKNKVMGAVFFKVEAV